MTAPFTIPLDYSEQVTLTAQRAPYATDATITLNSPTGKVSAALLQMMSIGINGQPPVQWRAVNPVKFTIPTEGGTVEVYFNGQPFVTLRHSAYDNQWQLIEQRRLTTTETRLIGRDGPNGDHPLAQPPFDLQTLNPLTDLHTHLSAQLSGRQLVELGTRHNILYPTAILDQLGIRYPAKHLQPIPRRVFLPKAHIATHQSPMEDAVPLKDISESGLASLAASMDLKIENQNTFGDLEECYFRREPFTKNRALLKDMLLQVAGDYQRHGITYAELSTNAVTDPGWLPIMEEAVLEAEKKTGVTLRFLAGMPRNLTDEALHARMTKVINSCKNSSAVVGIDWLGYESNKTSHIDDFIRAGIQWSRQNRPDWVHRIHAGENSKNERNVHECLELVEEFPDVMFRIGHATHGINDDTIRYAQSLRDFPEQLANPPTGFRLIFETLTDSNIANNTIDRPEEASTVQLAHAGIPLVISSDGPGIYGTDAEQCTRVAIACGMTPELMADMRKLEQTYIRHVRHRHQQFVTQGYRNTRADYTIPMPQNGLQPELDGPLAESTGLPSDGRQPVLIVGSQGKAWHDTPPEERQNVTEQLRHLILGDHLDPAQRYLVLGRLKDDGLGRVVRELVRERNDQRPEGTPPLQCFVLDTRQLRAPLPEGITGYLHVKTPLVSVPGEIIRILNEQTRHGGRPPVVIAAGGHAFTRDMILDAMNHEWPVMALDMQGASRQKGTVHPEMLITSTPQMDRFLIERCTPVNGPLPPGPLPPGRLATENRQAPDQAPPPPAATDGMLNEGDLLALMIAAARRTPKQLPRLPDGLGG